MIFIIEISLNYIYIQNMDEITQLKQVGPEKSKT